MIQKFIDWIDSLDIADEIATGIIVTAILGLLGLCWRYIKKYRALQKRLVHLQSKSDRNAELLKHGSILGNLKSEADEFLVKLLNDRDVQTVSLYVANEDYIYNFETLPNNLSSIHHKSNVLKKDSKTIVGQSFQDGELRTTRISDRNVSDELNRAVDAYKFDPTKTMATIPYKGMNGDVIFVLQIIGATPMDRLTEEANRVRQKCEELFKIMTRIFATPGWEALIPQLMSDKHQLTGSVIFFDLSNSSLLLDEFKDRTENMINNFISAMCDVVVANGGHIDKYTGDGAFITFNLDSANPDHSLQAIKSSIEMVSAMEDLRAIWLNYGMDKNLVDKLKIRVGVSMGEMRPFQIGHPNYNYHTYIGKPIHTAYHLCEGTDRVLRDRVLVDGKLEEELNLINVSYTRYDHSEFSKSVSFASEIFEIETSSISKAFISD